MKRDLVDVNIHLLSTRGNMRRYARSLCAVAILNSYSSEMWFRHCMRMIYMPSPVNICCT